MSVNVKKWLKKAGIRAGRAIAQTAVTMIGTSMLISEVNWAVVFSAAVLAGILSFLKSIAKNLGTDEVSETDTETPNGKCKITADAEQCKSDVSVK